MERDLSVIITARNEEFLPVTVEDVFLKRRGNTEVIVISDGGWPPTPVKDHPDLVMIRHKDSIGQRAAINEGVKLSNAKFIMKLDAHCILDEGFDVKLMANCEPNWTVIPRQYNLHAFNWRCNKCGNEWYQGPQPTHCQTPGEGHKDNPDCDGKDFERVIIWKPRLHRRSDHYRFDTDLKFQYWGSLEKAEGHDGPISETMSFLGACFFMHRKWYWDIGGSDEEFGSWGQQGTEISCKTWLAGGRLVTNKNTWFSHLFRTQGGDFGFPYQLSGKQVEHAREYSKELFLKNRWSKQIRPLSWIIEHFAPIPDWHEESGKEMLDKVMKAGELFYAAREENKPEKGIIYYTDNQLNLKIAHKVQKKLKSIGIPIVSASLKPMEFGTNVHLNLKRGQLTMFKQILAALEASTAEYVYFCEHDVLYHPSHFDFTPATKDKFYYNTNVWKVDKTGRALHYDCKQVSGICVDRELAIKHYRRRVEMVEKDGFSMKMGYEPGTHNRPERVDDLTSEEWKSQYPNIDIRHNNNLSPTRWKKEEFRNESSTRGWIEGSLGDIPGWDELPLDNLV